MAKAKKDNICTHTLTHMHNKTSDKFMMHVTEQPLTKRLGNRTQDHVKRITKFNQVVFIPNIQGWFSKREPITQLLTLMALKRRRFA